MWHVVICVLLGIPMQDFVARPFMCFVWRPYMCFVWHVHACFCGKAIYQYVFCVAFPCMFLWQIPICVSSDMSIYVFCLAYPKNILWHPHVCMYKYLSVKFVCLMYKLKKTKYTINWTNFFNDFCKQTYFHRFFILVKALSNPFCWDLFHNSMISLM